MCVCVYSVPFTSKKKHTRVEGGREGWMDGWMEGGRERERDPDMQTNIKARIPHAPVHLRPT